MNNFTLNKKINFKFYVNINSLSFIKLYDFPQTRLVTQHRQFVDDFASTHLLIKFP